MTKLEKHIETLEKENAELKETNKRLLESCQGATMMYKDLCKAKAIIKDYKIVASNITVCSVPEENSCINVLKLNEQAEQFLKEVDSGRTKGDKRK